MIYNQGYETNYKKTLKYKIWNAATISLLFFNENVILLCFRQNVWLKIETIGKKLKWKKGTNHKSKIYFLQIGRYITYLLHKVVNSSNYNLPRYFL